MTTEQINVKLTIWGTNRGSQIFCSDASLEEQSSQSFKDTLQEFSSVFGAAGLPFYGVEFTADCKVYTAYYSALETGGSRSGIFLAATIFVPHRYKLLDPLAYLQAMGQKVRDAFLDLNGRYKGGIPPSIERSFAEYREPKVELELIERSDFRSDSRGSLAYIICPDDAGVSAILREPYRREFKTHQEILLIPQAQIERGYFNDKVGQFLEFNELSPQHNGYRLQRNELINVLNISGVDRRLDYDKLYLSLDTQIEMSLSREGYESISFPPRPLSLLIKETWLKLYGENELRLDEGKLRWRRLKKTIHFTLRSETFHQTERAQLKLGDRAPIDLQEQREMRRFYTELEEELLSKEATLLLFKREEGSPMSFVIGSLKDVNLVEQKCQKISYPSLGTPQHEASVHTGKTMPHISGDSSVSTLEKGPSQQKGTLHDQRSRSLRGGYREGESEFPDVVLRYWKGILSALLSFLFIGYILGLFFPYERLSKLLVSKAQDSIGAASTSVSTEPLFTERDAESWYRNDVFPPQEGKYLYEFYLKHKEGFDQVSKIIAGIKAKADSLGAENRELAAKASTLDAEIKGLRKEVAIQKTENQLGPKEESRKAREQRTK